MGEGRREVCAQPPAATVARLLTLCELVPNPRGADQRHPPWMLLFLPGQPAGTEAPRVSQGAQQLEHTVTVPVKRRAHAAPAGQPNGRLKTNGQNSRT